MVPAAIDIEGVFSPTSRTGDEKPVNGHWPR